MFIHLGGARVVGHCVLHIVQAHGIDLYGRLRDYVELWQWPARLSARSVAGDTAFSEKRSKSHSKNKTFKCSMSEML